MADWEYYMQQGLEYEKEGETKLAISNFAEVCRIAPFEAALAYEKIASLVNVSPRNRVVWLRWAEDLYARKHSLSDAKRVREKIRELEDAN